MYLNSSNNFFLSCYMQWLWYVVCANLPVFGEPCFTLNTDLQGLKCVKNIAIPDTEVRSKIECTLMCTRNPLCAGIFYSDVTKTCIGCQIVDLPSTDLDVMAGSQFYSRDKDLNNLGCYVDCPFAPCVRAMKKHRLKSASMTIELCVSFCQSHGTIYSGVQHHDECYCDDVYDVYVGVYGPAFNCVASCSGNTSQICGGFSSYNAYTSVYKCLTI